MIDSSEVKDLCLHLGMAHKDVWRLRRQFNDEDFESTYALEFQSGHRLAGCHRGYFLLTPLLCSVRSLSLYQELNHADELLLPHQRRAT